MNCADVNEQLSAYFDAELPLEQQTLVAQHLTECTKCSEDFADFERLSAMVHQVDVPPPPRGLWRRLLEELDGEQLVEPASRRGPTNSISPRTRLPFFQLRPALAVAALVLLSLGWLAIDNWFARDGSKLLAADFSNYIEEFQRDPDAAQRMLLTEYSGERIDLAEAVQRVGYRPAVVDGIPTSYKVDAIYVLKMPCCDCLQTVCQRNDGSTVAIFEYGEEQPVTFGDHPDSSAQCNGKTCRLVKINDQFAASWMQRGRHISVVGVRDQEEIENLIASLDKQ